MAKTNFTKVEELLLKGQERLKIEGWIDLTREQTSRQSNPTAYLIYTLRGGLDILPPDDKDFFSKIGITKTDILKLIRDPQKLTEKDWALIKELHQKLQGHLKAIADTLPQLTDEELVEAERIKHINKRFNVNEKWLPLH